jgi:hypothetical protein
VNQSAINQNPTLVFLPVISLSVLLRAEVNLGGEVGPVGHDEVSALRDDRLHAHLPQHARDEVSLGRQVYNDIMG